MGFDCFIFDFDGTLAYSDAAYSAAFRHSIRFHTGKDVDESALAAFWGMNMTPAAVLQPYSDTDVGPMLDTFEAYYYANHHLTLFAYEGIPDTLGLLKRKRARVGIVSLKPSRAGERELKITGIEQFVDARVWGDDVNSPKPHPDGVTIILARLGADVDSTIMVGDSAADIFMGKAAGIKTGAALWGGAEPRTLLDARPDFEFHRPEQLVPLLGDS